MDFVSVCSWWLSEFAAHCNFCRATHRIWLTPVTLNIVVAMPILGQSIYFLYSIRAERVHMNRAWAIRVSTVIRLVFLHDKNNSQWNFAKICESNTKSVRVPFSMFNQNCCNCSMNGFNVLRSNTTVLLQNAGPILPKRVGQMPWIVQMPVCDGNKQTLFFFSSIHSIQLVIGQRWVNISTSKSWLWSCTNSTSFSSKLKTRRERDTEGESGDTEIVERNQFYMIN